MLDSLFNKVAVLKVCIFIKKGVQHRCFTVNLAKILTIPFLQNASGGYSFWKHNDLKRKREASGLLSLGFWVPSWKFLEILNVWILRQQRLERTNLKAVIMNLNNNSKLVLTLNTQ